MELFFARFSKNALRLTKGRPLGLPRLFSTLHPRRSSEQHGALHGIKILDLSRVLAVSFNCFEIKPTIVFLTN
jgi:hypothetical protein